MILKRLDKVAILSNPEELRTIYSFLEVIAETKFVKIHNDFQLDEITLFLIELFEKKSKKIYEIENSRKFKKKFQLV